MIVFLEFDFKTAMIPLCVREHRDGRHRVDLSMLESDQDLNFRMSIQTSITLTNDKKWILIFCISFDKIINRTDKIGHI